MSSIQYVKLKKCPPTPRFRRKRITLQTKLEILRRLSDGEAVASVCAGFGLSRTTVRTIEKNGERIRRWSEGGGAERLTGAKIAHAHNHPRTHRDALIADTEAQLRRWLCGRRHDAKRICRQARRIFDRLNATDKHGRRARFIASRTWYRRFNQRLLDDENKIKMEVVEQAERPRLDFESFAATVASKLHKINGEDENQSRYCVGLINETLRLGLVRNLTDASAVDVGVVVKKEKTID